MGLVAALQFLTRLPIRLPRAVPGRELVVWFPVAGALVGGLSAGVAWLGAQQLPMPVAGALGVLAGLLITGAFHEDGLGDVADAFGGGWNREQRLEILKDSRLGTYGVVAIVSSVLLRVLCAGYAPTPEVLAASFVVTGALGRVAAVLVLVIGRPATRTGLAATLSRTLNRPMSWLGMLAGAAMAAAALRVGADVSFGAVAAAIGLAVLAALVLWRLALAKIGGVVGDVSGAAEQVAEMAVWVLLVAVAF